MAYEEPKLIDLSSRREKGQGKGCITGSGETINCATGPTAELVCDDGGTIVQPKYED